MREPSWRTSSDGQRDRAEHGDAGTTIVAIQARCDNRSPLEELPLHTGVATVHNACRPRSKA